MRWTERDPRGDKRLKRIAMCHFPQSYPERCPARVCSVQLSLWLPVYNLRTLMMLYKVRDRVIMCRKWTIKAHTFKRISESGVLL